MKTLIILIGFVFAITSVNAQDSLRGPHQGVVKENGKYKIELVECNDYFEVFIYTDDMDIVHNYGNDGDIKYFYEGGTFKSYPLNYYGNDGFAAKVADGNFIYCRVSMEVLGTLVSLKFQNQYDNMGSQDK